MKTRKYRIIERTSATGEKIYIPQFRHLFFWHKFQGNVFAQRFLNKEGARWYIEQQHINITTPDLSEPDKVVDTFEFPLISRKL
jgi:hypothetical protein